MTELAIDPHGVEALRMNLELVRAELQQAREQGARYRADLSLIGARLKEEAIARGWCSDYGYFVDTVNNQTSQPWLEHCTFSWRARFVVTVDFTGRDQDDGLDAIRDSLGAHPEFETGGIDDVDVELTSFDLT